METEKNNFNIKVKGNKSFFVKSKIMLGYKKTNNFNVNSSENLLSILYDVKNENIFNEFEVINSSGKIVDINKDKNKDYDIIIKCENKTEFFKSYDNNFFKKIKEEVKDLTCTTIKTFFDGNIKKIEKYELNGLNRKKISEDIIGKGKNNRIYREFYSNGGKKLS